MQKKIIIFRTDRLGDYIIHSRPIYELKKEYSDSHIIVVCSRINKKILEKTSYIDELIELTLDSFEVLKLSKPPLLVILASSLFNIKSFKKEDVKIIEEKNELIQSKSPYLQRILLLNFKFLKKILSTLYMYVKH